MMVRIDDDNDDGDDDGDGNGNNDDAAAAGGGGGGSDGCHEDPQGDIGDSRLLVEFSNLKWG